MATAPHSLASQCFTWTEPQKRISVRLPAEVMERLELEVMKGYTALRKRGVEVGGLLLGKTLRDGTTVISVEDFEMVPCEYRHGPSYHLSDTDRNRLEQVMARLGSGQKGERTVVGCFRSHTRQNSSLDDDDLALIRRCLSGPPKLFLSIKPLRIGDSIGSLFLWQSNHVESQSSYLPFPFGPTEAIEEVSEPEPPRLTIAEQPAPSMVPEEPRARSHSRVAWTGVAAALALAVAASSAYRALPLGKKAEPRAVVAPVGLKVLAANEPRRLTVDSDQSNGEGKYEPARPVAQVNPVVPKHLRSRLDEDVRVRVRVFVDAAGSVTRSLLLTKGQGALTWRLGLLAADTARQWRFEPARRNGHAVPSVNLVHFEFKGERKSRELPEQEVQ